MKLLLKEFQTKAVDELVTSLRKAARGAQENELQSVCLASPTGSGKTIIVTAAIECILLGDDAHPPIEDAVFLWLTDQPELNEQTRRKMLAGSSVLVTSRLVVIDSQFDRETLLPGHVHFLNIQKLGKAGNLVTPGDNRAFTIWDTVRNTVSRYAGRFFVVIDEAHRGMVENGRARDEARSIVQKFIKSSPGEIPPVPLIVGVSATPERFNQLIQGTGRARRDVSITPEAVRESGLLKEIITLYHPDTGQPADMTMLRAAVETWKRFTARWRAYQTTREPSSESSEPLVVPILVIQVADAAPKPGAKHGSKTDVSKTDIAEVVLAIREATNLSAEAFAHAFQEGASVQIGESQIRYLAPADIQDDPDVRVVFFKTSLSTGWDCPRAEVMMSFRTAKDATLIAQLIGRMVRTPLARRVDADEYLNTVALYLPHYDEAGLRDVIDHLARPDAENMPPATVVRGEEMLTLTPAAYAAESLAALAKLPSYVIPRSRKSNEIRRLMKLARLLSGDGIDDDAPDRAIEELLAALRAEYEKLKNTRQFKTVVEAQGKVEVRAVQWRVGGETTSTDDATMTGRWGPRLSARRWAARRVGCGRGRGWGAART